MSVESVNRVGQSIVGKRIARGRHWVMRDYATA